MSKAAQQFLDSAKQQAQPEQSIGAVEATVEGVMGAAAAFLSAAKEAGGQIWDAAKPAFDHGRTEAAAALFSPHGSGFVMYGGSDGQKNENQAPDHGLPAEAMKQPEVQQPEVQKEQDQGMGY